MRDLAHRVAVVTGGASGIGLALAELLGREGMSVVIADVEDRALERAERQLRDLGTNVRAFRTDVSSAEQVQRLADGVFEELGNVHLLCNNAGVGGLGGSPLWERPLREWEWVFGVNVWGVVHGIRSFVPRMHASGEPGHVLNTASIAGHLSGGGIYGASKHAVVSISESLDRQLREVKSSIGVTVLCPAFVRTNIASGSRNMPASLSAEMSPGATQRHTQWRTMVEERVAGGLDAAEVAARAVAAVVEDRLYALVGPEPVKVAIRERADAILAGRAPADPRSPGR